MATALSVAALLAERDALRHPDKQAEEQLHRQRDDENISSVSPCRKARLILSRPIE
jgi:hypothetical protein